MNTVDCRTLPCPQPVMRCRQLLEEKNPSTCRILVDSDAAEENVRRFWEQRNFCVHTQKEGATFTLTITTREEPEKKMPQQSPHQHEEDQGKILIFITTEHLGLGDDSLGHKLMSTFLTTLPEMGKGLWRIILLNGGVRLAATQGLALEALQSLEKNGVDVLVCGTCLAHYGLADQKAVGQTSNMLDIVTSLAVARTVIRP